MWDISRSRHKDRDMRYGDISIFKMAAVRHLGIVLATVRDRSQSLLLATAACQISCQSDAHIWRYFAQLAWLAYSGPQNGGFGPPNVIIHHRYSQKAHPCVHSRLLSYQLKIRWGVWPVGKLTESGTHRHTHTGKFIFCPCIALDRQWSNNQWLMDVLYC